MLEIFKELFKYKNLLKALVVRNLALRYRGSVLGFLWTFLNPLALMMVYALVFKYYIRFDSVDNYTIFLFTGLLPWIWFTQGITEGASSIVSGGHLITKSMFPAHILPAAAVFSSAINFILSLPLLFLFMLIFKEPFHLTAIILPIIVFLQFLMILSLVWICSTLNVFLRDIQHIVNNILQFLFFLCPILYPVTVVPERFRWTFDFNPLAQITTMYHNVILDGVFPSAFSFICVGVSILISLFIGSFVYKSNREKFAELL